MLYALILYFTSEKRENEAQNLFFKIKTPHFD